MVSARSSTFFGLIPDFILKHAMLFALKHDQSLIIIAYIEIKGLNYNYLKRSFVKAIFPFLQVNLVHHSINAPNSHYFVMLEAL